MISNKKGLEFARWLEARGQDPLKCIKECTFTDNFIILDEEKYQEFLNNNAQKPFIAGVPIAVRRVKLLKIAMDFKVYKEFLVVKTVSGKWNLMGTDKKSGFIKLTTLNEFQMIKLLGEHFEEFYYEQIFAKK